LFALLMIVGNESYIKDARVKKYGNRLYMLLEKMLSGVAELRYKRLYGKSRIIWDDTMKLTKMALILWFLSCLSSTAVFACRFNVRDVGFVDLENQPYGFFCFVSNSTEKQIADDFMEIATAQLSQTNIKAITVNVDQASDHPAMKYLSPDAKNFPVFILLSPSKQVTPIDSVEKGDGFKDSLRDTLEKIVSSPIRKEIIEKTIDAFGVVLIIEGPDAEENKKAVLDGQAAIKEITAQMSYLLKHIAKPPVLIQLKRQKQAQEEILLWSMGIDADDITQPYAIIFYGRGRRMGPVLSGKDLAEEMLLKFFYVIGADCECDLDRSWMQGNMMPAKWDSDQLKILSEQLGFDTEHPMIKLEMSQIIRMGPQSGNNVADLNAIGGFGYQEIEIIFDPPALEPDRQANSDTVSKTPAADVEFVAQPESDEDEFKLSSPLYMIGIAGIFVLVIGSYFMILAIGKKR